MRRLVVLILALANIGPAIATKDRFQEPQSIVVVFGRGDQVTFQLSDHGVSGVTAHIGGATLRIPSKDCAKLHDIHFDTVKLRYPSRLERVDPNGDFEIDFDIGPESKRSSGELPNVQLRFQHAQYWDAVVTTRVGDSWHTSDL
jgi:hypothetical protein